MNAQRTLTYDDKSTGIKIIAFPPELLFRPHLDEFKQLSDAGNKKDPLKIVEKAVENTRPLLETKSRRVGGATYQVPIEVADNRSNSLAIRWLLRYARGRAGKSIVEKFSAEIMDAADNRGGSIKKKEDTHKMAKANRAFAHYRW